MSAALGAFFFAGFFSSHAENGVRHFAYMVPLGLARASEALLDVQQEDQLYGFV